MMSDNGGRSPRNATIDIARALVVIGVVFSHSIDGLVGAEILSPSSPAAVVNDALYIFRMPALAFMLGLFIPGGILKRGRRGYVRERATFFCYLYVVWFFLQTLAEISTSSVKNSPRGWADLLHIWSVPAHLWFLLYLAVSAVVIPAMVPVLATKNWWIPSALLTVVCVACWGYNPPIFGLRGLSLLVFTLAGAAVRLPRLCASVSNYRTRWMVAGAASTALFIPTFTMGMVPSTINGDDHPVGVSLLSALGACLGVVIVLGLAVAISMIPLVGPKLQEVGASTLEIYLAHVALVAGVRIVLSSMGVEQAAIFIAVSLFIGVALPMFAATAAPTIRMGWIFQPPAKLQRWSEAWNNATADRST